MVSIKTAARQSLLVSHSVLEAYILVRAVQMPIVIPKANSVQDQMEMFLPTQMYVYIEQFFNEPLFAVLVLFTLKCYTIFMDLIINI